jgi:hypothetical protein
MLSRLSCAFLLITFASCQKPVDPVEPTTSSTATVPSGAPSAYPCAGVGELSLNASGSGLEAYEGAAVYLVTESEPRLALTAVISGGAFRISCEKGLRKDNRGEVIALFLDADRDGACGAKDLGWSHLGYAWVYDAVVSLTADQWQRVPEIRQDRTQPFCDTYFPR